ncbi:hypothetical protein [Pinibacter soli]|uniref:Uncharacterized protein n=1 Tax=Pinibacter soli TaxID=3044211 RepID=A0ABT6RFU1_9BACT|nr:hypothetical protein [Pinibacter soli]MDI3321403.1 hypothetical protein [Pinibacter soli]
MSYHRKLHAACLTLAEELNWKEESEMTATYVKQTAEMTRKFIEIADKWFLIILDLPNNQSIIIGAINYLRGQAVGPSPDYYTWFENTLATLLKICNHQLPISLEDIPFLISLQQGTLNAMQEVLNKNAEEKKTRNNNRQTRQKRLDK